eukprot:gene10819-19631_t
MPNFIDNRQSVKVTEGVLESSLLYPYDYDSFAEKLNDEDKNWDLESMISDPFETLQNNLSGNEAEKSNDTSWDAINAWLFDSSDILTKDIKQESLSPTHTSSSSVVSEIEIENGIASAPQQAVQTFDINNLMSPLATQTNITAPQHCISNGDLSMNAADSTVQMLNNAIHQLSASLNDSQYKVYQKFIPIKPKVEKPDIVDEKPPVAISNITFPSKASPSSPNSIVTDQLANQNDKPKSSSKRRLNSETDFEQKKSRKQNRMARNRESALQSRQKKKEWMQTLEMRLSALSNVNCQLKFENDALKEKIRSLESENSELKTKKQIDVPDLAKKTSCVLVLFVFLAINVKPLSNLSSMQGDSLQPYQSPMRHGRYLLEHSKDTDQEAVNQNIAFNKEDSKRLASDGLMDILDRNVIRKIKRLYRLQDRIKRKEIAAEMHSVSMQQKANETMDDPNCTMSCNKTEVVRLNEALERLVKVPKKKTKKSKSKKLSEKAVKLNALKTLLMPGVNCSDSASNTANCSRNMTSRGNTSVRRQPPPISSNNRVTKPNELQTIQYDWSVFERFQKSIHREPDTFYFVSFRRDHILLPPLQLNETQRPRVSFIFPNSNKTREYLEFTPSISATSKPHYIK